MRPDAAITAATCQQVYRAGRCQGDQLLGDPKPGHNKNKIQIAFITCLEILNLCNMAQPTKRLQYMAIWLKAVNGYQKRPNETMQLIMWIEFCPPGTTGAKPGHFGVPKTTFAIPGQRVPNRDCPGKTGTVGQLVVGYDEEVSANWVA